MRDKVLTSVEDMFYNDYTSSVKIIGKSRMIFGGYDSSAQGASLSIIQDITPQLIINKVRGNYKLSLEDS